MGRGTDEKIAPLIIVVAIAKIRVEGGSSWLHMGQTFPIWQCVDCVFSLSEWVLGAGTFHFVGWVLRASWVLGVGWVLCGKKSIQPQLIFTQGKSCDGGAQVGSK